MISSTCGLIPYPCFRVPNFMVVGRPKDGSQQTGKEHAMSVQVHIERYRYIGIDA